MWVIFVSASISGRKEVPDMPATRVVNVVISGLKRVKKGFIWNAGNNGSKKNVLVL